MPTLARPRFFPVLRDFDMVADLAVTPMLLFW